MSKHTAGIWNALIEETATVRDANNNQLAIATHIKTRTGGRMDSGEVAANTRLMAAAPEMLEALRGAVCALAFSAERDPSFQAQYEQVSAAIDKAIGTPCAT